MKTLYTFKVKKPSFEEQTTKNEEGVETTIKTKVDKDVEIYIKKPSHREIDEMDLFYSIQISELQAQGISTNTMILNSYHDSGGLDSKKDVEAMKRLLQDLNIKRNRFLKESAENIDNPELLNEIKEISSQIEDYQSRLNSIFERSAESISERRVVQWCTLNLLFLKEEDTFKNVYSGKNYKDKLENYYNILDDDGDTYTFEKNVFSKGSILLSTWLKKQAENEEDFKLLESIIDEADEADE
jgi:hypothetical protein